MDYWDGKYSVFHAFVSGHVNNQEKRDVENNLWSHLNSVSAVPSSV